MFLGCGKGSDVSFAGDESIGGETVDKILSEAAKLKRKCKSLRTILLETETKRQEEKDFYDKTLVLVKSDFETKLSNIQSQHYIEVRCCTHAMNPKYHNHNNSNLHRCTRCESLKQGKRRSCPTCCMRRGRKLLCKDT